MTGVAGWVVLVSVAAAVLLWPRRLRRIPAGRIPAGRIPAGRDPAGAPWAGPSGRPANADAHLGPVAMRDGGPAPSAQAVADALVLLVLALRSGASVTESVSRVAESSSGAVRRDLSQVVSALACGASAVDAWAGLGDVWRPAALAFTMAAETGASPSSLLEAAARRVREQHEADRSRRAARAGVLLVLPLGLGFLPAFACTAVIPVVLALAGDVLAKG